LAPWGIGRDRIPVAFNIFMHVAVDAASGEVAVLPPLSRAGDHIRLRAEMPLVVAMTACSAGQSNNFSYKPSDFRVDRRSARASRADVDHTRCSATPPGADSPRTDAAHPCGPYGVTVTLPRISAEWPGKEQKKVESPPALSLPPAIVADADSPPPTIFVAPSTRASPAGR